MNKYVLVKERLEKWVRINQYKFYPAEKEYYDTLLEALEDKIKDEADGCEGCKYIEKDENSMPCVICKNRYLNQWKAGEMK